MLRAAGYDAGAINEIANMAFISGQQNRAISSKNPQPSTSLASSRQEVIAPSADQPVPLADELWQVENYPRFLEWRRGELAGTLNDFLDSITEVGVNS